MLIARLAAITAAASAAVALVGTAVHFAGTTAQAPARESSDSALLSQALVALRSGLVKSSATVPYISPPPASGAFGFPGLSLRDRYGVPAVYCAARKGLPEAPAGGYAIDGRNSREIVAIVVLMNQDPRQPQIVDAMSNPGFACKDPFWVRRVAAGQEVTNPVYDIDSRRSVLMVTHLDLIGGRAARNGVNEVDTTYVQNNWHSAATTSTKGKLYEAAAGAVGQCYVFPTSVSLCSYSPGAPTSVARWPRLAGAAPTISQPCPPDMVAIKATNLISGTQFPAHCADKYPRATASAVALKTSNASALSTAGGIVPMTAMAAERACKVKGLVLAPAESFQALAMTAAVVNNNWSSGAAGVGRFMSSLGQPDHAAGLPLAPDAATDPGWTTLGYSSALSEPDATLATGNLAGGYPANYLSTSTGANAFAVKRRHVYLSAADPTMVVYDLGLLAPTSTKVPAARLGGLPSFVNTLTSSPADVTAYGLADLAPPPSVSAAKSFATSSIAWGYATGSNVSARVYKRGLVNTYYADDRNAAAPTSTFRCAWFVPGTEPN